MASTKPEVLVKRKLKALCAKHGALIYDVIPSPMSVVGFPDHIIVKKGGFTAYVESKKAGVGEEGLSGPQKVWRDELQKLGATWFLFNGKLEEVEEWLTSK